MSEPPDDREYFFNRRTDKTIVSRRIPDKLTGQSVRIFSKIVDGDEGVRFAKIGDEIVLRTTAANRYEIKASVVEEPRGIKTLTVQKFNSGSGPSDKFHFSFVGKEISELVDFVSGIAAADLDRPEALHLSDDRVREMVLSRTEALRLFAGHQDIFASLVEDAELARDVVAIGYRRKQLQRFEALLGDPRFFDSQVAERECTPEALWQGFFEANQWIFGYGLSYQFLTGLDHARLERIVSGPSLERPGKRSDALLKTRGRISSLCFVEIKRHDTALLEPRPYRPGAWAPSKEVCGGVAQVQATVQEALEIYSRKIEPITADGSPTGETLFNVMPRSFLVVGSLSEFVSPNGISEGKFRSFELYRRYTQRPEIITFDELLERARFIVEHSS